MTTFIAELLGTMILILLGNGVVANVVLDKTKGNNSGWIVITAGWAMAVFVAVFVTQNLGSPGAHINPAVTLALATTGAIGWQEVPMFIGGQMVGAALGAALVWLSYRSHYEATEDGNAKLATFCTAPEIRKPGENFITEMIGTFVLVFAVLYSGNSELGLGAIGALPVGFLVFGIGLSLGGPTGYAINPARDLMPRIMHTLLPISGKRDSDWSYSWVPVLGPIVGAVLAALLSMGLN